MSDLTEYLMLFEQVDGTKTAVVIHCPPTLINHFLALPDFEKSSFELLKAYGQGTVRPEVALTRAAIAFAKVRGWDPLAFRDAVLARGLENAIEEMTHAG